MIAAKGSRIDNTIALLKENPAVNMRDATGNTPMHWALTEKNPPEIMLDVLVALKNNGADLKNKNYIGLTPLDYLNICQTWGDEYSILLKIITR
jgi:ankyrin repeat protein